MRTGGDHRWAMEVSIIRTCDGDLYASYEGSMGSGEMYARQEDHLRAEQQEVRYFGFGKRGVM